MMVNSSELLLKEIAKKTSQAAQKLGVLSTSDRNQAIEAIATALENSSADIIKANKLDCKLAKKEGISEPLYNRLKLGKTKLEATIKGVRDVINLDDPVGHISIHREF